MDGELHRGAADTVTPAPVEDDLTVVRPEHTAQSPVGEIHPAGSPAGMGG